MGITRRKKSPRQKLRDALDAAFSEYIRERDGYKCFVCGLEGREKDGIMQCGHLFTRASYSTRWDELNCFCQCRGCNLSHEYDPAPFTIRFIHKYGQEAYERLYAKSKSTLKLTDADMEILIGLYRHKKADMCNG